MNPTDAELLAACREAVPGGVLARPSDRLRMAHDASHYLLTPSAVVVPADTAQVGALLRVSASYGVPLTFRSGGTSLSGQAGTEHLLVDTRRHFRGIDVLDGGARVRVQPGATLRAVNSRLIPFRRRLGPDPASESACTVGGVVANNSSGMTCGTELNAYRTLDSVTFVLPSGTVVDTGARDADTALRAREPELFSGLLLLRDRIRGNTDSLRRIEAQYAMKNTMGYGLNAFVDHDTPAQILAHLAVGSEGTLGFIAEAVLRTVPVHPHAVTGLLIFPSLSEAMGSMPALMSARPTAVELLDAAALRVAQGNPRAEDRLRGIAVTTHAALLVEWQHADVDELEHDLQVASTVLADLPLSTPARLSDDAAGRSALWHIRKGLYAAVAAARPPGTAALLEDVAVPVPALADTCADLERLFSGHGYAGSVVFGHARDGNLHFMLTERFAAGAAPRRYAEFTEDLVGAVLQHGGTLKAEHGTGRVMAPYVRRQFGEELYDVMREVKALFDPQGVLNPGVLLSDDDTVHLQHLKPVTEIEPEVDRCVECGFCEPVCPSQDLTTTPRQRIVLRREIAAAESAGNIALAASLRQDYGYDAVETCAVDGMCATACPVLIDTGALVRRLRALDHGHLTQTAWRGAAGRWGASTRALAGSLNAAEAMPATVPKRVTAAARKLLSDESIPLWSKDLPRGGAVRTSARVEDPDAVYLPSCLNTLFAPGTAASSGVSAAVRALAERAGIRLLVPDDIANLCCGTPWSSKGMPSGYERMRRKVLAAVHDATRGRQIPVLSDASSCSEGFAAQLAPLPAVDAVSYVATTVLPRLHVRRRLRSVVLHPTCSSRRNGTDEALVTLAGTVADDVVVPTAWLCCAFAGDRGMLHPELTDSATRREAAEIMAGTYEAYLSTNRTCEIAMTRATGAPYRHVLELVEEATR